MSLEIQKIIASDGKSKSFFGNNVAIYNDQILISSPCDDLLGENSGSIYFYSKNEEQWDETQKITANDGCAFDYFGEVVVFDGTTLLASACLDAEDDVKKGVVYIYNLIDSKWTQVQKLSLQNNKSNSFGETIALDGNRMIIGSHFEKKNESIGSVFIFEKNESEWELVQEITAPRNGQYTDFGYSIALDDNRIVIGSFLNGEKDAATGAVYIYENIEEKWVETFKLIAKDPQHSDFFGNAVAIKGNRIIIGAHGTDDRKGAVYLFEYKDRNWVQIQKLASSNAKEFNCFGNTIALSNDKIIAGAFSDSANGIFSGSVYIFEKKDEIWEQTKIISSHEDVYTDYFGESLAIHNDKLLIGAYGDDENGICAGAVHVCDFKH